MKQQIKLHTWGRFVSNKQDQSRAKDYTHAVSIFIGLILKT